MDVARVIHLIAQRLKTEFEIGINFWGQLQLNQSELWKETFSFSVLFYNIHNDNNSEIRI